MMRAMRLSRSGSPGNSGVRRRLAGRARKRVGWLCALGCAAAFALATGVGMLRSDAQQASMPLPAIDLPKTSSPHTSPTEQTDKKQPESAPAEASKQGVAGECADLLKMATALKMEVDKTTKDTLSVTVIRKADEIEELARKVRDGGGKSQEAGQGAARMVQ